MKKNDLITLASSLIYTLTHYEGEIPEEEKRQMYTLYSKSFSKLKKKKGESRIMTH